MLKLEMTMLILRFHMYKVMKTGASLFELMRFCFYQHKTLLNQSKAKCKTMHLLCTCEECTRHLGILFTDKIIGTSLAVVMISVLHFLGIMSMYLEMIPSITSSAPPPIDNNLESLWKGHKIQTGVCVSAKRSQFLSTWCSLK